MFFVFICIVSVFFKGVGGRGLREFLWKLIKWESVLWVDYFMILKEIIWSFFINTPICPLPRATVDEMIHSKGLKVKKKKKEEEEEKLIYHLFNTYKTSD